MTLYLLITRIFPLSFHFHDSIPRLCDRNFGIGSDGLILIQSHPDFDFEMIFFNPDGSSGFCGNGSRCAVAFAFEIGLIELNTSFLAFDGLHEAVITDDIISVRMADCQYPKRIAEGQFIHTGSPHFILTKNEINSLNISTIGKEYRLRTDLFGDNGANVNFLSEKEKGSIFVRTYERGVEAETLSCGTGVTAAAICYGLSVKTNHIHVETLGGELEVSFNHKGEKINDIYLSGPATKVYRGSIQI